MRIALVIERFEPLRGGREASTAEVASALVRRGHEVTVLCQEGRAAEGGAEVRALGVRGRGRAARLLRFVAGVRHAVRHDGFDVVHATLPVPGAHVYQPRGGLVPAQAATSLRRRRGLQRLATMLGQPFNPHRRRMAQLERRVVDDPAVLCLAVSEMVGREFLHYYARSQRVRVVYNGVEVPRVSDAQREQWRMEFRNRLGVEVTAPVFLTAAMNFKLKGVAEAIGGFARWYHSPEGVAGARLVAVGQEETGSYRLKARARGVAKQVHFVAPTGNVFPWYAAADACILLSWYDPCSRVVLEATRWGIPSITTAYNGAGEILAGGAGIVVSSPRDTKAVAAALAALADSQRRAECAEACRKIADRLTMDRHVEQLLEAYAEAVEP